MAPMQYRRSLRLDGYDYSLAGGYFLTVCTKDRRETLSRVEDEQILPTEIGHIATHTLLSLPERFSFVTLDAFVVMPNHVHATLILVDEHLSR